LKDYVRTLRELVGHMPLILAGTSVLIVDDFGRLLLMQRADTGGWGLPGGLMEPGESFEETGRREVQEETGLCIGELTLLDIFSGPEMFYVYPNGDQIFNVTAAYIARDFPGEMRKDVDEVSELAFFQVNELPDDIISPDWPLIESYLQTIETYHS
jgi:8-oxo-dGTP pyrophosphatase MutT (NUDIX family)